jgi:hypothetical protein
MTALTKDASLRIKGVPHTEIFTLDSSAAQTIYKGQPIMLGCTDTVNGVGFIAVDNPEVDATDVFIGIAAEGKTVVAASVEANQTIELYVGPTILGFKSSVFTTLSQLGLGVYMTDSGTLALVASVDDAVWIGTLWVIEDGYCYVKLSAPQICSGA